MIKVRSELFVPEPFPRIEFERVRDFLAAEVDERAIRFAPSDVVDEEGTRENAGLFAGVAEIEHGLLVFRVIADAAEINRRATPASPRLYQVFVNGVELIRFRPRFLQPEPLRDRGLDERGR